MEKIKIYKELKVRVIKVRVGVILFNLHKVINNFGITLIMLSGMDNFSSNARLINVKYYSRCFIKNLIKARINIFL